MATFTKVGFVVKFIDERSRIHDLSHEDTIIAFYSLCCGLYTLDVYENNVDVACLISNMQEMTNASSNM